MTSHQKSCFELNDSKGANLKKMWEVLLDDEKEINSFLEHASSPLPVAVRITKRAKCINIDNLLLTIGFKQKIFSDCFEISEDQFNADNFTDSRKVLHVLSVSGYLRFQEVVSQIGVRLLDVQREDKVFDMCAAPGGKTLQAAELLEGGGLLVANDADPQRAHEILGYTARLARCPAWIGTICGGQKFPEIRVRGQAMDKAAREGRSHETSEESVLQPEDTSVPPDTGTGMDYLTINSNRDGLLVGETARDGMKLEFDRVICDVPCSADGTMRKNWTCLRSQWNFRHSLDLSRTQVRYGIDR